MSTSRLLVSEQLHQQHAREDYFAGLDEAIRRLKLRNTETIFAFVWASIVVLLSIVVLTFNKIHSLPLDFMSGEHQKLVNSEFLILLQGGFAAISISIALCCYRLFARGKSYYRSCLAQNSVVDDVLNDYYPVPDSKTNINKALKKIRSTGIPFWLIGILGVNLHSDRRGHMKRIIANLDRYLNTSHRTLRVEPFLFVASIILFIISFTWNIFTSLYLRTMDISSEIYSIADWLVANHRIADFLIWPGFMIYFLGMSVAFYRRGVMAEALRDLLKERFTSDTPSID